MIGDVNFTHSYEPTANGAAKSQAASARNSMGVQYSSVQGADPLYRSEQANLDLVSEIKSDGSGTGFSGFNCGLDTKYKTTPREVREQAIKVLPDSIRSVLKQTDLKPYDISMFIPHQASINVLRDIAREVV